MFTDFIKAIKIVYSGLILVVLMSLAGCSSYSNSFGCPDAKGLHCMSVSSINARIDSGEIEEVERIKCKGRHCRNKRATDVEPELELESIYSAIRVNGTTREKVKFEGVTNAE